MLELPVERTADADKLPVEPPHIDKTPFTETSAWTSKWQEQVSSPELVSEAPSPLQETPEQWSSRRGPTADPTPSLHEAPALAFPSSPAEEAHSEPEEFAAQSWEDIVESSANSARNQSPPELSDPWPSTTQRPTFYLVLGWLGLLCLAASVALLAFDWFGWTW
jgi:hypothetical protein